MKAFKFFISHNSGEPNQMTLNNSQMFLLTIPGDFMNQDATLQDDIDVFATRLTCYLVGMLTLHVSGDQHVHESFWLCCTCGTSE